MPVGAVSREDGHQATESAPAKKVFERSREADPPIWPGINRPRHIRPFADTAQIIQRDEALEGAGGSQPAEDSGNHQLVFVTGSWFTGSWFTGSWFTGSWFTGSWFTGSWFTGSWFTEERSGRTEPPITRLSTTEPIGRLRAGRLRAG
jgi:hypothetical protein